MDKQRLIERLEAATEGSRELDTDIHEAIGKCAHRKWEYYCVEDGNSFDSGHSCASCRIDMTDRNCEIPLYTTSLDARLPGENITQMINRGDAFLAHNLTEDERLTIGVGRTEPLARRIAALKAREAMSND